MATNKSLKNQLTQRKQSSITNSVKSLLNNEAIKKRFEEILKQRAPQYMSSIINLVNSDTNYWSKEQIEKHRKKFSKSDYGWKNDYDAMAKKTVLRNMLSKWNLIS